MTREIGRETAPSLAKRIQLICPQTRVEQQRVHEQHRSTLAAFPIADLHSAEVCNALHHRGRECGRDAAYGQPRHRQRRREAVADR